MKKVFVIAAILTLGLTAHAQIKDSLKRVVKMEGAYNFRDVGGYKTTDGKEVVLGKIFRSDAIDKLTDKDLKTFSDKKIKTVIDFRGIAESRKAPDRLPPNTSYLLSPSGSNFIFTGKNMADIKKMGSSKDILYKMYGEESLPYFGERFRPLFEKLVTMPRSEAILFHCTGGRDRTGTAAALLLTILGVPKQTVVDDYVASNYYLSKNMEMKKGLAQMAKQAGVDPEEFEENMKLTPELLDAFFNAIIGKYESLENFFEIEMGIGTKEIAILKERYLR